MSVFSERLTETRKMMGWTRKRAVSEIGIPYQTYSNYEQGKESQTSILLQCLLTN